MFMHFEFKDGSNPYIATTNRSLYFMLTHYDYEQIAENMFIVHGKSHNASSGYEEKKGQIIDIAIEWQNTFSDGMSYSYSTLADWQWFFEEYGRRYGLLTEFRENCIC